MLAFIPSPPSNGFHLGTVLSDICSGTATKSPTAEFNRIHGRGTGRLRLDGKTQNGGSAEWEMVDNNDPGNAVAAGPALGDQVTINVLDASGTPVMTTTIECSCLKGNVNAHQRS